MENKEINIVIPINLFKQVSKIVNKLKKENIIENYNLINYKDYSKNPTFYLIATRKYRQQATIFEINNYELQDKEYTLLKTIKEIDDWCKISLKKSIFKDKIKKFNI